MKEAVEKAVGVLLEKIKGDVSADDALKYTQAVLNLASAENTVANTRLSQDDA